MITPRIEEEEIKRKKVEREWNEMKEKLGFIKTDSVNQVIEGLIAKQNEE